ncbi:MAG: TrkA family potassium uptake protein [Chloroflexi bacterium]|nr:TrkA family potassium uptake protein [Chloroflexota bacterium]
MHVVIVGCGRVGSTLATQLDAARHSVAIVDQCDTAFLRLPKEFSGQTVLGTGIDEDVLRLAGIERADAFAAVMTADNRNIMAAQVAKYIFGVKKVVCRIYDPLREQTYRELGLETICPTTIGASIIAQCFEASAGAALKAS